MTSEAKCPFHHAAGAGATYTRLRYWLTDWGAEIVADCAPIAAMLDAVQGKLLTRVASQKDSGESASELLKKIKAEKAKLVAEKKIKKEITITINVK